MKMNGITRYTKGISLGICIGALGYASCDDQGIIIMIIVAISIGIISDIFISIKKWLKEK